MKAIVFPGDSAIRLRTELLTHSPNEAAAILLCAPSSGGHTRRVLVREIATVPPTGMLSQGPLEATISPEFYVPWLKRARLEGWSLFFCHTHPFSEKLVRFSHVDDEGERRLVPLVNGRAADRPNGSLVLGRDGFDARTWEGGAFTSIDCLSECGPHVNSTQRSVGELPPIQPLYDRSLRAFGADGQRALSSLRVGIVGLGGTGSLIAQSLAHLGVRDFVLMDPDQLDTTNLNRVVGANGTSVGDPKVYVAERMIAGINADATATSIIADVMVTGAALPLLDCDFIFSCTDSHGSRAVLNQLAYQHLLPVIDMGVAIGASHGRAEAISGRVQMLAPGLACLVCQSFLNPEQVRRDFLTGAQRAADPYITGAREPQPAVISLNSTVCSLAVTMMLSAVTGFPAPGRHLLYLGHRGSVRVIDSTPRPGCVICSLSGSLARGDLWALPGKSE